MWHRWLIVTVCSLVSMMVLSRGSDPYVRERGNEHRVQEATVQVGSISRFVDALSSLGLHGRLLHVERGQQSVYLDVELSSSATRADVWSDLASLLHTTFQADPHCQQLLVRMLEERPSIMASRGDRRSLLVALEARRAGWLADKVPGEAGLESWLTSHFRLSMTERAQERFRWKS